MGDLMYKAATAKTRTALDGFSAGELSIQEDGLKFPLIVSDSNGKVVATHAFALRPSGDCTSLAYDEDGNIVLASAINSDAAVGALEMILAAYAKAAGNGGRATALSDELLAYLVSVGLLPK
jgi:hypothetical protein